VLDGHQARGSSIRLGVAMSDRKTLNTTRRQRRAHAAQTRAKNREQLRHHCALDKAAEQAGVTKPVGLSLGHFHAVHRALGEARCPRCPHCDKRLPVEFDKPAAMARWDEAVDKALGEQRDAKLAAEIERDSWKPGPHDEEVRPDEMPTLAERMARCII
jgi:hypothetical protein